MRQLVGSASGILAFSCNTEAMKGEAKMWPSLKNTKSEGLVFKRRDSVNPLTVDPTGLFSAPATWTSIQSAKERQ